MSLASRIRPGQQVRLDEHDPGLTAGMDRDEGDHRLDELSEEVGALQELLYASRQNSVLIVLQGMDTSGKDGTIRQVMSEVNPLGCRVESFKVPTEEELAHDFLWRVHKVTPQLGMMTIFNRSHYEDVIVVRVRELVPETVWRRRYDQINDFERLLAESGTIILKFFLHISRYEQKERLEDREKDTDKAWKLSAGDWKERERWDDYMRAYEEALTRCTAAHAPWYVVPADKKWFRNVAVAEAIASALRPYRPEWEESLSRLAKVKLAELKAMRESKGKGG